MPSPLVIKVNETPTSFIKGGGLKGYVLDQQVVSWSEVLASASRKLDEVGSVPTFRLRTGDRFNSETGDHAAVLL